MIKKSIVFIFLGFLILLNNVWAGTENLSKQEELVTYGISQILYWYPDIFTDVKGLDKHRPVFSDLTKFFGRKIKYEIRKSKDRSFYVLFPEIVLPGFPNRKFDIDLDEKGERIWRLGDVFADNKYVMGDLISQGEILIPRQWYELASHQEKLSDYEDRKLRFLLADFMKYNHVSGKQHFFVGPFNHLCEMINVYWVEGKEMVYLYNEIDHQPLEERTIMNKSEKLDDPNSEIDFLQNVSTLVFSRNNLIGNCVYDGFEVEISPLP